MRRTGMAWVLGWVLPARPAAADASEPGPPPVEPGATSPAAPGPEAGEAAPSAALAALDDSLFPPGLDRGVPTEP